MGKSKTRLNRPTPANTAIQADPVMHISRPPEYLRIRTALLDGSIHLHYQPIHSLATGQLQGFEALARWGALPPPEIARQVEAQSLQLTWARQQIAEIDLTLAALPPPLWVSLNVSQSTLELDSLPHLLNSSPHPRRLRVEVLESVTLRDRALVALNKIHCRHVVLADDIGDLGGGWLDRFLGESAEVFDGIKLCKALTHRLLSDRRTAACCRHVLALANDLGLSTTAEWVESEAQRDWLLQSGCQNGQGALFGLAGHLGQHLG